MLFDYDHEITTLKELGLTLSQAKVYVAVAKLGKVKARDLWKASGVGRQEIYRILYELSEMGLIEKEISTPTQFRALPLSKGSVVLLDRKRREISELEMKIQKIEDRNISTKIFESQESEFCILPRKHLMENRGQYSFSNAKETIDIFSPFKRLASAFTYNISVYENPVKRGIQMRVITERPEATQYEQLEEDAEALFSRQNFDLRFAASFYNLKLSIIDGKEGYFALYPSKSLFEDQVLWTNNLAMIVLAQQYFEMVWSSATIPRI